MDRLHREQARRRGPQNIAAAAGRASGKPHDFHDERGHHPPRARRNRADQPLHERRQHRL